jgi:ATP-dependent Lon protease
MNFFSNRTMASGNQQREANNINMSLMQLWRCLYAVKKKNDSNDMVPFRESKLTHILMPTLYRVGTSGASMIACVNPQSADYDETISVLGNASLACEINVKEIVPAVKPPLRKIGSRSSVTSNANRSSVSSNTSGASSKASANEAAVVAANKESRKRKAEITEPASKTAKANEDVVVLLKEEIESLKAAHKAMESAQLEREQEIREEVCNEMAEYSQSLLDQIQELQEEIIELKSCGSDNRKSVRKVKREQRSLEHEEAIKNLADSEEEMERQKKYYDAEIKALKQEIRASKIEIADWKLQAESVATHNEENSATKKLKRKPLGTISPNVSPTQESGELFVKAKKDKRSTSPYRETDGSGLPGIAPPVSPKMVGTGPFFSRSMRSTTVRI